MEIQCKPFVTAFTVVKSNFYHIVTLKKNDPLEFIFVSCFVHTMHIMLPGNWWSINSLD